MKRFVLILIILFAVSCSSDESRKIEINKIDAFAFQLDEGWELNGSAIIKNFTVVENENNFSSKLSYYINLTQPDSSIVEEADYGLIDISEAEELSEYQLNFQIELDSGFSSGNYNLLLIVLDDVNGTSDSISTSFELSVD